MLTLCNIFAVHFYRIIKKNRERKQREKQERLKGAIEKPAAVISAASTAVPKAVLSQPIDKRHLHNYRVVQRNLVYVIGIPSQLALNEDQLRRAEYFGQYGKIGKVVIHRTHNSTAHATVSAYVTFVHKDDAKAAIQALDGFWVDGHVLRASFGTTKYCNNFIRGVPCNNPDCVYLHDFGDDEDRFTKEEIQVSAPLGLSVTRPHGVFLLKSASSDFSTFQLFPCILPHCLCGVFYYNVGLGLILRQHAGHTKLVATPGKDQSLITGNGGPSGTGKRVPSSTEPVLPPPVFLQDNPPFGSASSSASSSVSAATAVAASAGGGASAGVASLSRSRSGTGAPGWNTSSPDLSAVIDSGGGDGGKPPSVATSRSRAVSGADSTGATANVAAALEASGAGGAVSSLKKSPSELSMASAGSATSKKKISRAERKAAALEAAQNSSTNPKLTAKQQQQQARAAAATATANSSAASSGSGGSTASSASSASGSATSKAEGTDKAYSAAVVATTASEQPAPKLTKKQEREKARAAAAAAALASAAAASASKSGTPTAAAATTATPTSAASSISVKNKAAASKVGTIATASAAAAVGGSDAARAKQKNASEAAAPVTTTTSTSSSSVAPSRPESSSASKAAVGRGGGRDTESEPVAEDKASEPDTISTTASSVATVSEDKLARPDVFENGNSAAAENPSSTSSAAAVSVSIDSAVQMAGSSSLGTISDLCDYSSNGLSQSAVFPVPVSSLRVTVWSAILHSSQPDLLLNPFGALLVPLSELLDLTMPPIDGASAGARQSGPKPPAYYSNSLALAAGAVSVGVGTASSTTTAAPGKTDAMGSGVGLDAVKASAPGVQLPSLGGSVAKPTAGDSIAPAIQGSLVGTAADAPTTTAPGKSIVSVTAAVGGLGGSLARPAANTALGNGRSGTVASGAGAGTGAGASSGGARSAASTSAGLTALRQLFPGVKLSMGSSATVGGVVGTANSSGAGAPAAAVGRAI